MTKRKPAANRKGRWANYNGPGRLPNGEWGYWREQFEAAWSHLNRR
jgi:hypothetical protein